MSEVLQARIDELNAENKALYEQLASLKNQGTEAKLAGLAAEVVARTGELTARDGEIAGLTAQLEALKGSLVALTGRAESAEAALAERVAEKAKADRVALVASKGGKDVAVILVEKLAGLSDAAFAETVDLLVPSWAVPGKSGEAVIDAAKLEADPSLAVAVAVEKSTAVTDFFATMFTAK